MNSAQQLPLAGKTVVVTRGKEQAKKFSALLTQKGATVLLFPALEIVEPATWEECDSALEQLNGYSGIIFTSANAVTYFFRRVNERKKFEQVTSCTLYAVGEQTKSVIERCGLQTEKLPETFSAEKLAETIAQSNVRGKRFLFPKGNFAKEDITSILSKQGAVVDEVTVYNTQEPPMNEERQHLLAEIEQRADLVTFFSPLSVVHSVKQARKVFAAKKVAVIGHTTAAAARKEDLNVVLIAPRSTAVAFADAIEKFYENNSH